MKRSFLSMMAIVATFAATLAVSCNYNDDQIVENKTDVSQDDIITNGKISLNKAMANAEFVYKNT